MKRSSRLVLVGVSAVVIGVLGWTALAPRPDAGDSPARERQVSWKDTLQPGGGQGRLGPQDPRDTDTSNGAELSGTLQRLNFCAWRLAEAKRDANGSEPSLVTALLRSFREWFDPTCKAVTPELLAQRTAWAERLVAMKWPGAVRTFEATLDRPDGYSHTPANKQQLATLHREAGLRGDEPSLHALASFGSIYGLTETEMRAWGHLAQRCHPAGLRVHALSDDREPFLFFEQQPAAIKAYAKSGLPVPPVDAKVDADARTLAANWPCPTPAN